MVNYIIQLIIIISIIVSITINKNRFSKSISTLTILVCLLCVSNIGINISKISLDYNCVNLFNNKLYLFYGLAGNIISVIIILLSLFALVLIFKKIFSGTRNIGSLNILNKIVMLFLLVLVCLGSIQAITTCINPYFDLISDEDCNVKGYEDASNYSDNELEGRIDTLIEQNYITDDVCNFISILRTSNETQLIFIDQNVKSYSASEGTRLFYKYIEPITNNQIIKEFGSKMYFKRPEIGVYDIIGVKCISFNHKGIEYINNIVIIGEAAREESVSELTADEEVIYVYMDKYNIDIPKIGFFSFVKYKDFKYFYEFLGESPIY